MRLARAGGLHPGQGPGSNNTSISTDGDLDLELHHHHTAGVNRKNSGNSLLTATTLESRESDSRPQSRSGTISPVSDSFIDDSDVLFSYNGGLVPSSSHSQVVPIHSGIASRRQGNIVVPGYLPVHMGATSTRIVNFHPNQIPTKGVGAGTGLIPGSHSSLQTMHAQATAQMAYLMDNQRRDTTRSDVLRVDDNASIFESTTGAAQGGIGSAIGGLNGNLDQISSMDFARLQQRFEENRALDIQRRQQQQQQILQNQALLVTRQQQALLRQRTSPFTFPESSGVNQEQNVYNIKQNFDFDDNGSSSNNLYVGNQFERRETISNNDVDLEESSSSNILSTLNLPSVEQRENFNVQYNNQRQQQLQFQQQQQQFQQQLQQQQLVTVNSSNNNNISENNEFKFSTDLPYAPPPVIGILKKQQVREEIFIL